MRYSGSKARIASEILPIITKNLTHDRLYIEPFVGGCNMFSLVDTPNKIGIDINRYVISMWEHFQHGGMPPKEVSQDLYSLLCDIANSSDAKLTSKYGWLDKA
jgi:site-specific DNA-adenine methylase